MEAIFGFIVLAVGWYLFWTLVGTGAKAVGAAAKTASSGGSFADNFSNNFQFKVEKLPDSESPDLDVFGIYGKGSPEISTSSPVVFIFKLIDKETSLPIISTFENTSEADSRVFEHSIELGDLNGQYFPKWARLSALIPSSLVGPHKGTRQLELKCYIWYQSLKPSFVNGWLPEGSDFKGGINVINHEFSFLLSNPGYMEENEERLKIQVASIKLAISIALADGSLDKSEGNEIKSWIKKIVDSSLEEEKQKIKLALNNSLEEGFNEIQAGSINIENICNEILDIGSKADKYDLLELCLDVMAADGEADANELKQISEISSFIGIDYEEVTRLKDKRIIKLEPGSISSSGLEELLGIDLNWSKEEINKHILKQYSKYNARLNTVSEGQERENTQNMLDKIAEARQKYS